MAFKTVTAALLAGGITLGAIVTWGGGDTLEGARNMITDQAAELNLFGQQNEQMKAKILEMRAELDKLNEFGTERDQARIAELEGLIADAEAAVASDAEGIEAHIKALEAEITAANDDAAALQVVMNETGDTPDAMSERELGDLLDGKFVLPPGTSLLEMYSGTPQIVPDTYNELKIDKTIDDSGNKSNELTITNTGSSTYNVYVDGTEFVVRTQDSISLGLIADLEGSILEVQSTSGTSMGKFYLTAE